MRPENNDEELAKAIDERTIFISLPPTSDPVESRTADPEAEVGDSNLGLHVEDFELDIPAKEGIDP